MTEKMKKAIDYAESLGVTVGYAHQWNSGTVDSEIYDTYERSEELAHGHDTEDYHSEIKTIPVLLDNNE